MKKYIPIMIFTVIFLTGLSLVLYPAVSDMVNRRGQSKVVTEYNSAIAELESADYSNEWAAAEAYNEYIRTFSTISAAVLAESDNPDSRYEKLLNVAGNRVMGIVRIPAINISMPIYHTTEEAVLQTGAGHYIGSSLPVGGAGSHSVITGHRGLPSAKLFTDLDHLAVGDQFYILVLGEILAYEIEQIEVVLPEAVDTLSVVPGKDYVTLVTCTPYGVNSHRMLLRGSRVSYEEDSEAIVQIRNDMESETSSPFFLPLPVIIGAGVGGGVTAFYYKRKRKRK